MIRLLGALLDLIIRLMPTPKDIRDKQARDKRDERKNRIGRIFTGSDGVPWWVR